MWELESYTWHLNGTKPFTLEFEFTYLDPTLFARSARNHVVLFPQHLTASKSLN
jgi:hypothetical protein